MVTLTRPRCEEPRQFTRGTRFPNISSSTEFRVITLKDPVVDPEWMFHHPRFRRETKPSGTLPQNERRFHAKRVYSRVPSASGNARSQLLCERRERDQGDSTCRHFCELLGPNLCKECWKLVQRTDSFMEHRDSFPSELKSGGNDSFSAMVALHEKRRIEYNDSEEEILDETEDEEFISKSIGSRKASLMSSPHGQDSGYSSRMSYIRSLSRTPSGDFCPRVMSRSKITRGGAKTSADDEREVLANNHRRSSEVESTTIWKNAYLAKLREREPFREILTKNLRYPRKLRHAWRDLSVEPVVMDLKFINFTIYDGTRLNEREVTKNAKE